MASSSFRDSMNSLGWSRREQTATTSKPSGVYGTLSKLNPFNSEGYVRLPVTENEEGPGAPLPARTRREEEEGWFARKSSSSYSTPSPRFCFTRITLWKHHRFHRRGMSICKLALSSGISSRLCKSSYPTSLCRILACFASQYAKKPVLPLYCFLHKLHSSISHCTLPRSET